MQLLSCINEHLILAPVTSSNRGTDINVRENFQTFLLSMKENVGYVNISSDIPQKI
jgi:hypothetical protein